MPPTASWTPILEKADVDLARATARAIAQAVRALPEAAVRRSAHEIALFEAYLVRANDEAKDEAAPARWLDVATDLVAEQAMTPALWGGFLGVAWVVEHVQKMLRDAAEAGAPDDLNEDIDAALLDALRQPSWRHDYDLIGGLCGMGVYALERMPRPAAAETLGAVIEHLARLAERTPEGLTFWTSPELMLPETRARYPSGYYNLGLAHGVPGVLAVLAGAYAAGCERERLLPLLDGTADWLLAQRRPPGFGSMFPYTLSRDEEPRPARSAWCYGDPGVAAALLCAARACDRPEWQRAALAIAHAACGRPVGETGVVDAGLCHGAAGLAQIYSRMAQSTGDDQLARAAQAWLVRTLELRRDGEGIAGYRAWRWQDEQMAWGDDPGMLTGAIGVGLTLLSAAAPVEPGWDRLLLLSLL